MAAENSNRSMLKMYTSTRKNTFTLVTLPSFSISGVILAEKNASWKHSRDPRPFAQTFVWLGVENWKIYSHLILHLKCWHTFLILLLANVNFLEFSAAILEKGLWLGANCQSKNNKVARKIARKRTIGFTVNKSAVFFKTAPDSCKMATSLLLGRTSRYFSSTVRAFCSKVSASKRI